MIITNIFIINEDQKLNLAIMNSNYYFEYYKIKSIKNEIKVIQQY